MSKIELFQKYVKGDTFALCFIYDSDFKNAKILREAIEDICLILGISPKWKSRLTLIVDELNNNAIEYGSQGGEKNYMRVRVVKNSTEVTVNIEVEDAGNGSNPKKAIQMDQLRSEKTTQGFAQHHSIRGRGLFMIITSLVDSLYFRDSESGGLIV